jgi:hypothetical protein
VANLVLQIPISRRVRDDFTTWPLIRFGDYTVSSSYNMARKEKFFIDRSASGRGANSCTEEDIVF